MVHAAATSDLLAPPREPVGGRPALPGPDRVVTDDTAELRRWLAERRAANRYEVRRVPFAELDRWAFDPATGNLGHDSGQFFTVEGLAARTDYGTVQDWSQPIINQPDIGILGILVKRVDGVVHCLMQAKMEPGNINMIQLSPTVQATRSNLRRVHQGSAIRYLEYFSAEGRGRVLVDVLQSEQGAWFHGKRNRNMFVEVDGDVPEHPDFRWVPLRQLCRLLAFDDLANMDTRTVLSCLPVGEAGWVGYDRPGWDRARPAPGQPADFTEALRRSFAGTGAHRPMSDVLSWFNERKLRHELKTRLIPLDQVEHWHRTEDEIARADGRYFSFVGVSVQASNREVSNWTQPLLAPAGIGLVAFLAKQLDGVLHVLVHARVEAGYRDVVELAPTVQSAPDNYRGLPGRPRYLDEALNAPPERIRFDAIQSDEGGRLYHAQNRHLLIEVGEEFPVATPEDYTWMTLHQLTSLASRSYHLNIQARSLVACSFGLR